MLPMPTLLAKAKLAQFKLIGNVYLSSSITTEAAQHSTQLLDKH